MELSAGLPPAYPMPHVIHCLDILRNDVICYAGDTPRYATTAQKIESGMGAIGNAAIRASWRGGRQKLRAFGGIQTPRMTRIVKLGGGIIVLKVLRGTIGSKVDGEA